jgi:hypothetical protein
MSVIFLHTVITYGSLIVFIEDEIESSIGMKIVKGSVMTGNFHAK